MLKRPRGWYDGRKHSCFFNLQILTVNFGTMGKVACNMVAILPLLFEPNLNQLSVMERDTIKTGDIKSKIVKEYEPTKKGLC